MPTKFQSRRADGRGHWPAGKSRHADAGDWPRVRLALRRALDAYHEPGVVSCRALARVLGASDRTVRDWLAGTYRPDAATQEAIEGWLSEVRERAKRRRQRT